MTGLDFTVMGLYFVAFLAIGAYFAARTDDAGGSGRDSSDLVSSISLDISRSRGNIMTAQSQFFKPEARPARRLS